MGGVVHNAMDMGNDLYSENQRLRRQLKAFISQARANEEKLRRFQVQEHRLITLNSLVEVINALIYDYRTAFKLDMITLVLIDPSYEIRHILEDEGVDLSMQPELIFLESGECLEQMFGLSGAPRLGLYSSRKSCEVFPPMPGVGSAALIPLTRYGELIGCLNFSSHAAERFVEGAGTDFLQGLASVAAICLENAINHERLKRVGLTDFLTGVNNRRFFDQRLTEEVSRSLRGGQPLGCLLLDIDNFKKVNDNHGHRAGDMVLKAFAALIRQQLRSSDVLARFGGEEFSVLLINSPETNALEVAERIRCELANNPIAISNDQQLKVTVSIGLALLKNHAAKAVDDVALRLVDAADQALYKAKHAGKNQVQCAGVIRC